MLKYTSVSATATLAERLAQSGIKVSPMVATPLHGLVQRCYSPVVDSPDFVNNSTATDVVYRIADTSGAADPSGASLHCGAVGEVVAITKEALQADFYVARNVLSPVILAVVEDVQNYIKQCENRYANVLAVVPDIYDNILKSPIFLDMIKPYSDASAFNEAAIPAVHETLSREQVVELLKSGSSRFDEKDLAPWLEEVGLDFVHETYTRYFTGKTVEGETSPSDMNRQVGELYSNSPLRRRELIVLHLIARRFSRQAPDSVRMAQATYEQMIDTFAQQTGRLLNRVLDDRERNRRMNRLIVEWPRVAGAEWMSSNPELAQIVVNMDLYESWLANGGSPEVLFGAAVTDRNDDPQVLLENAQTYIQKWEVRHASIKQSARHSLYNNTLIGLRQSIARQINELPDDMVPEGNREPMHNRVGALLNQITIDDVMDLYKTIRALVSGVMFPHTNARLVLETMDSIAKDSPNLPMREVATVAAFKILARWYRQQMQVTTASAR